MSERVYDCRESEDDFGDSKTPRVPEYHREPSVVERMIAADRASPRRILILGDCMTDVYVHGRLLDPSSCQEGCPKFVENRWVKVLGGASNAARTLSHWRAEVKLMGSSGVVKTRYMAGDTRKCVWRTDDDRTNSDHSLARNEARRLLSARWPHAVLLSDYDKGFLEAKFIEEVVYLCGLTQIPCVADCKREPRVYFGCILKGNDEWWQRHPSACSKGSIVLTQGAYQPFVWVDGEPNRPDGVLLPIECRNHVGAGDAFAAHLALGLAHGLSLKDAAGVAHSAGRVYVQREHNTPPWPEEIAADAAGRGLSFACEPWEGGSGNEDAPRAG